MDNAPGPTGNELNALRQLRDRREIRRVYAALIRRFPPETHGHCFQEIREAYDEALFYADQESQSRPEVSISDLMEQNAAAVVQPGEPSKGPEGPEVRPSSILSDEFRRSERIRQEQLASELDKLWTQFSTHPATQVVARIAEICGEEFAPAEAFLMAYWSEVLTPGDQKEEFPGRWLLQGLTRIRSDERFARLLFREFAATPELIKAPLALQILTEVADTPASWRYIRERWILLSEMRKWTQLLEEIQLIRDKAILVNHGEWLELMLMVNEYSSLSEGIAGGEIFSMSSAQVNSLDIAVRFRGRLNFLDLLRIVRRERNSGLDAGMLGSILNERLHTEYSGFRSQIFFLVARFITNPVGLLAMVDSLMKDHSALGSLLISYLPLLTRDPNTRKALSESRRIERLPMSDYIRLSAPDYKTVRADLLHVATGWCIEISELCDLMQEYSKSCSETTASRIADHLKKVEADHGLKAACEMLFAFQLALSDIGPAGEP